MTVLQTMQYGILPLIRDKNRFPGTMGVPGADFASGLRMHPTARVFYVDPNHANANVNNDGTDPEFPLSTVQAAHDKCIAYNGDIILVSPSNYGDLGATTRSTVLSEAAIITTPGISLIGMQMNGRGVAWDNATGICLEIRAPDTFVKGFWFSSDVAATAVRLEYDTGTTPDRLAVACRITECYFAPITEVPLIGITLEGAQDCIIDNCFFEAVATGIASAASSSHQATGIRIQNNIFLDCVTGAIVAALNKSFILDNIFHLGEETGLTLEIDGGAVGLNLAARNILGVAAAGLDASASGGTSDVWTFNQLDDAVSYAQASAV